MELSIIIGVTTFVVTILLGFIAKKVDWVNNKLIPIQNILVGVLGAVIYYYFTKDINFVVAGIGLFAGGTYDVVHNLQKLLE